MTLNIWCYVSESLLAPEDETTAIRDVVARSRRKNVALGVSGALIFTRGRFAQYIEGPPHSVAGLRRLISGDPRHANVTTLREDIADDRRFAGWSMAYAGPSSFISRAVERPLIDALHGADGNVNALIRLMSELARAAGE